MDDAHDAPTSATATGAGDTATSISQHAGGGVDTGLPSPDSITTAEAYMALEKCVFQKWKDRLSCVKTYCNGTYKNNGKGGNPNKKGVTLTQLECKVCSGRVRLIAALDHLGAEEDAQYMQMTLDALPQADKQGKRTNAACDIRAYMLPKDTTQQQLLLHEVSPIKEKTEAKRVRFAKDTEMEDLILVPDTQLLDLPLDSCHQEDVQKAGDRTMTRPTENNSSVMNLDHLDQQRDTDPAIAIASPEDVTEYRIDEISSIMASMDTHGMSVEELLSSDTMHLKKLVKLLLEQNDLLLEKRHLHVEAQCMMVQAKEMMKAGMRLYELETQLHEYKEEVDTLKRFQKAKEEENAYLRSRLSEQMKRHDEYMKTAAADTSMSTSLEPSPPTRITAQTGSRKLKSLPKVHQQTKVMPRQQGNSVADVKVVKETNPQSQEARAKSYAQHAVSLARTGLVASKTKSGSGIPPKPGNEARSKWRAIVSTPAQNLSKATKKQILSIGQERPPQKFHRLHIEISGVPNETVYEARRRMGKFLNISGLSKHIRTFSNIGKRYLEIYYCDAVVQQVENIIRANQLRVKRELNPAAFENLDPTGEVLATEHTRFQNQTGYTLEKRREQAAKRIGYLLATQTLVEMRKCIENGFDNDLLERAHLVANEYHGQQLARWQQRHGPKTAAPEDNMNATENDESKWFFVDRKGKSVSVDSPEEHHTSESMDVEESGPGQQ